MNDLHKSRPFMWGLIIIFCVFWFYFLGARTLVPTDEGRYAEMAREMAATGDWITPRLNAIKYFEKPPLQAWMNALTFTAFGLGEWQARLWTGLCGLLGIVLTACAGRKIFGDRVGFWAGVVLASCFWWSGFGHINSLDMGLAGMMTVALCGLLIGQRDDASRAERRTWMLVCWAGMALAVMSKGLIGIVLPGAVLVLYTLLARDWAIWKRLHFGLGLLVFFGITTPWFVLVSLQNPEFPRFFFIHEHWQRFTSNVHHREGAWYYFVPLLLAGIMPWLGMLVQSLWSARTDAGAQFRPKILLLTWACFIFFFFSISGSKLPSYILPIFPALALLVAAHLEQASRNSWIFTAALVTLIAALGLAYVPMLPTITQEPLEVANYRAAQPWAYAGLGIMLTGAVTVLWWSLRKREDLSARAVIVLGISGFLSGQLLLMATEPQGRYRAGLQLVPAIEAELKPGMTMYAVGMYDQTLPYYLRRTMVLVGHSDEMTFGLEQQPELWLPKRETFVTRWTIGGKALAITRPEIFEELQQEGLPMRVVARDSRRVVIANDQGPVNAGPNRD